MTNLAILSAALFVAFLLLLNELVRLVKTWRRG
jgi:hypothetical protein